LADSNRVPVLLNGFWLAAEAGILLRIILSGALDRHPGLKLLSGHWGELVAGWLERLDETTAGPTIWIVPSASTTASMCG
jgi:predicted TIM-barrel fold metal-dependent hydrolase